MKGIRLREFQLFLGLDRNLELQFVISGFQAELELHISQPVNRRYSRSSWEDRSRPVIAKC